MSSKGKKYFYKYKIGKITIKGSEIERLFLFESEVKVNNKNRVSIVSSAAKKVFKCPVKGGSVNHLKDSISMYFTCILNEEQRYCLKCDLNNIKIDSDLNFEVWSTLDVRCDHSNEKESRSIRGEEREKMKQRLLVKLPKMV